MNEKTYLRILQFGIIASLFFVFFVFKGMLFPYITSKQFAFNILIEMMFALWLVFVLKFPKYRPKKNYIVYGVLAYFSAILMSLAVSVDPALSFWGDAERMLGFFHLLHFLLFFLMLISVFRNWQDYKVLLMSSVLVATIVSLIGIFGENIYSTIGNTAYVSGYLIFNIFFAILLFFREKGKQIRYIYLVPIIFMLWEFVLCKTSGAIIGLVLSLLLLFFLIGLFHDMKVIRRGSLIAFAVAVIAIVIVFSQSDKQWFQESFLSNLTSQKWTFQTRLISWQSAAKDFPNHPVFGTGFGTYATTFDRHFDSKFFNYTVQETYFDRAHNNLIDIASTTGLVGLITYLSIFIAVLYYLIKEFKLNGKRAGTSDFKHLRNLEVIILISLLSAYFIQNLAIFDSYVTYIGLMITLGFIYFLSEERKESFSETESSGKSYIKTQSLEIILLIVFLLSAYIATYNLNIKPRNTLKNSISAYSLILSGQIDDGFRKFQDSLMGHPLERDARVVVINLFNSNWDKLIGLGHERAEEIVEFVVSLAEKNASYNPYDNLMQVQLAQVLDNTARFYGNDNLEVANQYSARAMQAIEYAIEASPGRAPVYLSKAQMQLVRGENEEAIETVEYAISLNPEYYQGYCRLAQFYMILEEKEKMYDVVEQCVDLGGSGTINSGQFLISAIEVLVDSEDYHRAILLAERLSSLYPEEANFHLNLAKLNLIAGNNDASALYLQQAYALDQSVSADWEQFLDFIDLWDMMQE